MITPQEAQIIIGNIPIKPEVLDDCYDITEYQEAKAMAITALKQQASEKEHKIGVTYICDGKRCPECSKLCRHTTDISHAKNFKPVMSIDGETVLNYEEVAE